MAEAGKQFIIEVAAQIRQFAAQRRRRRRFLLAILCLTVPLSLSAIWKPPILLVWNASPSAPVGLYWLSGGPVRRGDMVVAKTPEPARSLAARRHYLPANVPLIKRVAAVGGDRICANGPIVSINGRPVVRRRRWDAAGRPMPWWVGCNALRANEYFLLVDNPRSFDGRYFGMSHDDELLGRATLLWTRQAVVDGRAAVHPPCRSRPGPVQLGDNPP